MSTKQSYLTFLQSEPLLKPVVEAYLNDTIKNSFVQDVIGKLVKYGSLSPAQTAAVLKSVARDAEFAAKRAAEAATLSPAPVGRVIVTGTVLTVKCNDFGTYKMLVKSDANFKVWASVPSDLQGSPSPLKGQRISFTVTLKPSPDDATFAFGSRPSGGTIEAAVAPL